ESNQAGHVLDSVILNTESRCVCASVPTTIRSIGSCAFVKNRIPIWPNHFCDEEIFDGTQACSFGPCRQYSASSTDTHRNWRISFRNFGHRKISRRLCASASANCHAFHSIMLSWKRRIAFLWWRPASNGTTSEVGERWRIILRRINRETPRTAASLRSIPATTSFSRKSAHP